MPPILHATYRLQLHRDFPFARATELAPYLARLGVSHVYTSPILTARPGSTHGYDVADPAAANPELGGEDGRCAFARSLHTHGLGHLLDIVPNHMGTGPANRYWEDVLRHGRASRYAAWFDVDWNVPGLARGRIVLPVLGRELDEAIDHDELSIVRESEERDGEERDGEGRDGDALRLRYFEHGFPLDPATTRGLVAAEPADWTHGPEGRARLRALLARQHYRLAFWRTGARSINYRRFFDVDELAALRIEDPAVFDAAHARVLEWVGDGSVDGLRIDHVDGLRDPAGYLARLRAAVEARRPGERVPILVEKILSPGERLRDAWPVEGTTGYEFLNDLESVFIDPHGFRRIERAYVRLARIPAHADGFHEVAFRGKRKILRGALRADVSRLVRLLLPIARGAGVVTGARRGALVEALQELIIRLPVYRTYVDGRDGPVDLDDRRMVDEAVRRVLAGTTASPPLVALLRDVLLGEGRDALPADERGRRLEFVLRFQQASGPATAKGVEDTALYQYVPLVSLNEVGGEPARDLADAVRALHHANAERAARWPRGLVCTNTHDTKRSADVRARLDVLTEMPDAWLAAVARWRRTNAALRGRAGRRAAPDANAEYLLYQTVVGVWPADAAGGVPDDPAPLDALRDRVATYMLKAVREAKQRSTWTDGDQRYEDGLRSFVAALFDPRRSAGWLADVAAFVGRVARPGYWNALARVALHLTAPGTPDVYQGDELWHFALVDPDNRRPVDYAVRAAALDEIDAAARPDGTLPPDRLRALLAAPEDGRLKLYLTARLLRMRRAHAALADGGYLPLAARGPRAGHVVAFARTGAEGLAVTVAPRLPMTLTGGDAPPVGEAVWGDTALALPDDAPARWVCALSGDVVHTTDGAVRLAEVLAHLPVALLLPEA